MTVALRTQPDTLGQAWGQTLGLTFGTLRFHMSTKKFKWVSRIIMFPLIFALCPVPMVGTLLLMFIAWRLVRFAQMMGKRLETRKVRKAQAATMQRTQKRNVRRIRFEIKIG